MMLLLSTSLIFLFVFTFSHFLTLSKIFYCINVFNANIAIMSFFGSSNEFYTMITLLMIRLFIYTVYNVLDIRYATKKFIS